MNKTRSRLASLMLALLLALSITTGALADASIDSNVYSLLPELAQQAADTLYANLMATQSQEEYESVFNANPVLNALCFYNMSAQRQSDLVAHYLSFAERTGPQIDSAATAANGAGVQIAAPANAFPENTSADVAEVTDQATLSALAEAVAQINEDAACLAAFDISFPYTYMGIDTELQPAADTPVSLTFTVPTANLPEECQYLTVYHMVDNGDGTYTAEPVGEALPVDSTSEDQSISVDGSAFSIYVVIGTYSDDWNYNNYKIVMVVGDTLQVSTSTGGYSNYTWRVNSGDTASFSLNNANARVLSLTANAAGTIELICSYRNNYSSTRTENITVVALDSAGSDVNDDIVFANIDKAFSSGDEEYENTYGPYVMKIRFEDTDGNLLRYEDGTTVGEDYYVFDSECAIDVNTFAADAPDGYTYAGAFFYWTGHDGYDGAKVYVTNVDRDNSNTAYGSHLYYSGTHDTSGQGRWTYQPSGVLHVVYAQISEVHTVIFKDHCGYELANYALPHNDGGVKFPSGYTANIDTMANATIPNHHNNHDVGYEFEGTWVVTGGGSSINGTYSSAQLKSNITRWTITSNITITAQCSEPDVTINYVPVTSTGGSVSLASETIKVGSGVAQGSTATPAANYKFVGWYAEEACETLLSEDPTFVPDKVKGKNVAATYYAKFEIDVGTLTITKEGLDQHTYASGDNESAIVTVTDVNGKTWNVVLCRENGYTAKLIDLPAGSYTVTEQTGWTWRYTNANAASVTAQVDGGKNTTVTFENDHKIQQWLGGDNFKVNNFGTTAN